MAYVPTTWQTGDVVTSAKLNNIEQGIVNAGVMIINEDPETYTLDKTWQEIADAPFAVIKASGAYTYIAATITTAGYMVVGFSFDPTSVALVGVFYVTQTADGYPVYYEPNDG